MEFKFFVENNKWRDGCPFFVEHPWEDVPSMCKDKFSAHALAKLK